jgi:hypothetical protein
MEQSKALLSRLASIFNQNFIQKLSKDSGFEQRVYGRIKGSVFVNSLICLVMEKGWISSLTDYCALLLSKYEVKVTEQSINERFNSRAEQLMKSVLQQVLSIQFRASEPMRLLPQFTDVYLQDATNLELHPSLSALYKGCGGGASEAGLKIGVSYSLGRGDVSLQFLNSASSDTSQRIPEMAAGSLLIRDLGYFKIEDFVCIRKMGCYYLSRYRFGVNLYEDAEGKVKI